MMLPAAARSGSATIAVGLAQEEGSRLRIRRKEALQRQLRERDVIGGTEDGRRPDERSVATASIFPGGVLLAGIGMAASSS